MARGVDVTLFATLDSLTSATLDGVSPHGYAEDAGLDGRVCEALHVSHALARSGEFDLVHNHLDWLPLAFDAHAAAPMVTTVHGFSGPGILPAYAQSSSALVSISDSDRSPDLDYLTTIYHGVDLAALPFRAAPGPNLVAFGRIHPDKGTADAIAIARRAGRPLVICGIVQDARYFAEQVEPHIDGENVVYRGSVGPDSGPRSWGRPLPWCTRSISMNRSGCPSLKPWRAERRSSRIAAVRCPRSSTWVLPATSSTTSRPPRRQSVRRRGWTGQRFTPGPACGSGPTGWSMTTYAPTAALSAVDSNERRRVRGSHGGSHRGPAPPSIGRRRPAADRRRERSAHRQQSTTALTSSRVESQWLGPSQPGTVADKPPEHSFAAGHDLRPLT